MPSENSSAASVIKLVPGLTLCMDCRSEDAEVTVDPGERWQRHVCLGCADDELEREVARELHPATVAVLRQAEKEPRWWLPTPATDWETADRTKLNGLKAQWRAYEAENARTLAGASRCWAMRADGSRCVRDAVEAGVCETHQHMGCTVPGLGWLGDAPQGPLLARRGRSAA